MLLLENVCLPLFLSKILEEFKDGLLNTISTLVSSLSEDAKLIISSSVIPSPDKNAILLVKNHSRACVIVDFPSAL